MILFRDRLQHLSIQRLININDMLLIEKAMETYFVFKVRTEFLLRSSVLIVYMQILRVIWIFSPFFKQTGNSIAVY